MQKFIYNHPMNKEGKVISPISEMILFLSSQIEMQELAKQDVTTLRICLEVALRIHATVETPMLKGVYMDGRYDHYHDTNPAPLNDDHIIKRSEEFFNDTFY